MNHSVYMSICLYIHVIICPCVYISMCHMSMCLYFHVIIFLFVYISMCHMSMCLYFHVSIYPCVICTFVNILMIIYVHVSICLFSVSLWPIRYISSGGGDILGTKKPKIGTKNNNVVDRERGACKKNVIFKRSKRVKINDLRL